MSDTPEADPVLARRARIAAWVTRGLRLGYGLFGAACVLFFVALVVGFGSAITTAITVCLFAGSVVLAPSIIFSYAVRAADRADREGTW